MLSAKPSVAETASEGDFVPVARNTSGLVPIVVGSSHQPSSQKTFSPRKKTSCSISMLSSLKSLATTPFSWFANPSDDSFETEDTPGKCKLVHSSSNSNPYDSEGDQKDPPLAYRVKRIRFGSLDRVPMLSVPSAPTPYLPPSPSLRPSTHTHTHASKPARPHAPSSNTLPIPRLDTSRHSPLSSQQPPRTQAAPVALCFSFASYFPRSRCYCSRFAVNPRRYRVHLRRQPP